MQKRRNSILVFLFLLLGGFVYLNKVFSTSNHFVNTMEAFEELTDKTNIDVLIFGSSHAYTAFNPVVIDNESNTLSFNLGSDALLVPVTDLVVIEALKKTDPKLIILEIYPPSVEEPDDEMSKGFQLRVMDRISNFSKDKFYKAQRFYSGKELASVYFPLIRNHDIWNKVQPFNISGKESFDESIAFFNRGYLGLNITLDSSKLKGYEGFIDKQDYSNSDRKFIDERAANDIIELIKVSKERNAKILVVSAPDIRAKYYWNNSFLSVLEEICSNQGANYLNLNDYYQEMDLKVEDFRDPSHLNIVGAYKASKFLGNYINENYSLPNRSSDDLKFVEKFKNQNLLNKFIAVETKSFHKKVNYSFTENISIDSINIQNKGRIIDFYLLFDSAKPYQLDIEKYNLLVKIYPKKEDLGSINELFKERGWNYDKIDVPLSKSKNYVSFEIATAIEKIEKIEMLLYNKVKYEGAVGNRIFIKEISFE